MASFTAGTTFVDGVANNVTAAKLGTLVTNATPTSGFIQDRTAETVVATNDTFLIGDASDSNTLKRMTVANVMKAEHTGTINTTAGTITTLNSTTGTITGLNSTTGTVATLNSTTGTITTGVIPTLTSITKITSGTGTAAAPAISPTGDTNTGIFFPAADTIAFSEGGTEAMRIDSSGNVGIGETSPTSKLFIDDTQNSVYSGSSLHTPIQTIFNSSTVDGSGTVLRLQNGDGSVVNLTAISTSSNFQTQFAIQMRSAVGDYFERLRIDNDGNVGIGTTAPATLLDVSRATDGVAIRISSQQDDSVHSLTTPYGSLEFYSADGSAPGAGVKAALRVYPVATAGGSGASLAFNISGAANDTEAMRINSAGNVGIGTTSPTIIASSSKVLDIVGDLSGAVRFERTNATNPTYGYVGATNGAVELNAQSNSPIVFSTFGTNRLSINSSGGVTIAGLAGSGSRAVNASAAGLLSAASDAYLKEEVVGAHIAGLDEILQIHPKMYRWKDDIANRGDKASVELGFIANDVAPIIPSAAPMGNDGLYGFYDRSITAALVKAVQELKTENDSLKSRIEALEAK